MRRTDVVPIRIFTIALVFGACFLNGCATSRGVVSLATPTSDKLTTSKGIEIYIHSVVDKRIFEAAPRSPNIPSLDPSELKTPQSNYGPSHAKEILSGKD